VTHQTLEAYPGLTPRPELYTPGFQILKNTQIITEKLRVAVQCANC